MLGAGISLLGGGIFTAVLATTPMGAGGLITQQSLQQIGVEIVVGFILALAGLVLTVVSVVLIAIYR
jgi:hypothetical protein